MILENIDIDKAILQNINIDKISNRFKFGISNRATRVCGRGYFGSWKGLFCVVIGKVCLREQFLINLICRDSASILRVELLA